MSSALHAVEQRLG